MKRLFLLSAALVAATVGFAQKAELKSAGRLEPMTAPSKTLVKSSLPRLDVQMQKAPAARAKRAAATRSITNGVYYVPTGGLYMGWNKEGMGSAYTVYEHAPFTPIDCVGTLEAGSWHINGQDTGETGTKFQGETAPAAWYYAPTFVVQADSFNIGETGLYYWYGANEGGQYEKYVDCYKGMFGNDSICTLYPVDDHAAYLYEGSCYSNVASWGYMDSDNMFGTGKILGEEEGEPDLTSFGFMQDYRPLASPLYVEDIFVKGCSFSTTPLKEGDVLRAVVGVTDKGEETFIDTLYCTAADVDPFTLDEYGRNEKTIYNGVLTFTKKVTDAFGNETVEPVVIPAGVPFSVYVLGFDDESVDFGAEGLRIADTDVLDSTYLRGYNMVTDGEKTYYYGFQANIALNMGFTAMFDKAYVHDNSNFNNVPEGTTMNALRVSDDGKTCTTDGQTAEGDYNLGAVCVGTACPWFDEEENPNYELITEGEASWITGIRVDNSEYAGNNWYGCNFISVECEALPAGVTGRMAVCRIAGRGVESEPFYILQGDAQIPSAIAGVKTDMKKSDTRVYNVAGQQVGASAKGLLIKGGKKVIVK